MTDDIHVDYWDCSDYTESLTHENIEEAVESWVGDQIGPLPETVQVFGFARMELPSTEQIANRVLEHLYEYIDDEYGDPNGDFYQGSAVVDKVMPAAMQFVETFKKEYHVWGCEQVTSKVVKVADYYTEIVNG